MVNKKAFVNHEECSIKKFFLIFGSTKSVGQQNVYFVGLSRLVKLKALKITINDQQIFQELNEAKIEQC